MVDCVCMYRPIQGNGMWYATHACVWRMQLDLLNRVFLYFHLKDWCEWGIFGTGCPLSENSFGSSYVHRMPLNPDMSLLHDWQTWRWNFIAWPRHDHFLVLLHVVTQSRIYLPPLPLSLSLIHWWALRLLWILSVLHTFFLCCFYPFVAAAFSKPWLFFFMKRQGLIHSGISSYYPTLSNNIVTITEFQYLSNTITSSLALIVMLQLKWWPESRLETRNLWRFILHAF